VCCCDVKLTYSLENMSVERHVPRTYCPTVALAARVTRLSVLNTNVASSQRPSVLLSLFLISSPSTESRRLPVNTRLSTKEISGWPEESGIFHFWKF
jgi:hypothetical protein